MPMEVHDKQTISHPHERLDMFKWVRMEPVQSTAFSLQFMTLAWGRTVPLGQPRM